MISCTTEAQMSTSGVPFFFVASSSSSLLTLLLLADEAAVVSSLRSFRRHRHVTHSVEVPVHAVDFPLLLSAPRSHSVFVSVPLIGLIEVCFCRV